MNLKIITLEEEALYELARIVANKVVNEIKVIDDKWITGQEAMQKLGIKSKTTLQKLRDEGKIRFSQPARRIILYDVNSIDNFLEDYAKETF